MTKKKIAEIKKDLEPDIIRDFDQLKMSAQNQRQTSARFYKISRF